MKFSHKKKKTKLKLHTTEAIMKENWITNMEIKLRGAKVKIKGLQKKAKRSKKENKEEYRKIINDLQVKHALIKKRMNDFVQSKGEIQDDIQHGIEKTFNDLDTELTIASKILR